MGAKKKGEGGRKVAADRPRRNVVPPESDRQTDGTGDSGVDPAASGGDLGSPQVDQHKLTAKQRRFVEILLADPGRNLSQAAWRAGYCGGSPDAPYPTESRKRKTLAQMASKAMAHPAVEAYRLELEGRATAAFFGAP